MQTRRNFLKNSIFMMGSLAVANSWAGSPNEDIRVAVVGLRWRGLELAKYAANTKGVKLVALCDIDSAILEEVAGVVEKKNKINVERIGNYFQVLDRSDIDVVVLATPNHWHALQTIWACQAGKDVYVEKPVCNSVWEGRRMVEAAEKYDRVVQPGFQNRSDVGLQEAFPWILDGNIGEIKQIRGLCYRNRASIGIRNTPLVPPSTLDYDTWLGPSVDQPLYRDSLHYDWHWDFNTGAGDIGNQGAHELDLIRWVLGGPEHAKGVVSYGGRFAWNDAGNTPNMLVSKFDFGSVPVVFEVRDMCITPKTNAAANYKGNRVGIVVTCEGGEFRGGRGGGTVYDLNGKRMKRFRGDGGEDHFSTFIEGVRSRKLSDLALTLEEGYRSSVLSHLANASYRVGSEVSVAKLGSYVGNDELLQDSYGRYMEHLNRWAVDLDKDRWTLGEELVFDSSQEVFVGGDHADMANYLVKPIQRAKFSVPEVV